ncbi:MAG TPA: hypothetical protein VF286_02585 [Acidiphilium sp.]
MRTTLTIDDDILTVAKDLADRDHKTIGAVISALAREALRPATGAARRRNGIPLLPARGDGKRVTLDLVNRLRDDPLT